MLAAGRQLPPCYITRSSVYKVRAQCPASCQHSIRSSSIHPPSHCPQPPSLIQQPSPSHFLQPPRIQPGVATVPRINPAALLTHQHSPRPLKHLTCQPCPSPLLACSTSELDVGRHTSGRQRQTQAWGRPGSCTLASLPLLSKLPSKGNAHTCNRQETLAHICDVAHLAPTCLHAPRSPPAFLTHLPSPAGPMIALCWS